MKLNCSTEKIENEIYQQDTSETQLHYWKFNKKCYNKTQVKFNNSTEKQGNYMTMSSIFSVTFKLWIILNLVCFLFFSSVISSQRFVLHSALSISTKASAVTEIE